MNTFGANQNTACIDVGDWSRALLSFEVKILRKKDNILKDKRQSFCGFTSLQVAEKVSVDFEASKCKFRFGQQLSFFLLSLLISNSIHSYSYLLKRLFLILRR